MSKYITVLKLAKTGECVKEDSSLRLDYVLTTMLNAIPEDKRKQVMMLCAHDINVLQARIKGE